MEGIHVGIHFHTKDTRSEAIEKLLETLYEILGSYKREMEDYKFKRIEIDRKEDKEDSYIAFNLYGENEEKKEYLDIDITVWYKEEYERVEK